MRMIFSERCEFTPKEKFKDILLRAFNVIQHELGLADHVEDIEVSFVGGTTNDGGSACIDGNKRHPMKITISSFMPPAAIIHCMAHEMVHGRDMVRGRLTTAPGVTIYDGVSIPNTVVRHTYQQGLSASKSMPHEKEAYETGPKVAQEVFRRLPLSDLQTVALGVVSHPDAAEIRAHLIKYAEAA